jgi:hypothetical protein
MSIEAPETVAARIRAAAAARRMTGFRLRSANALEPIINPRRQKLAG